MSSGQRELVEEYGIDTLRYFTLREMSFGLDASFGHDTIVARKNSDLANDLGQPVQPFCRDAAEIYGGNRAAAVGDTEMSWTRNCGWWLR